MGTEGMLPSLLVFGTVPNFPFGSNNTHDPSQRVGVIKTAREEMDKIIAELQIVTALKALLPPASK